MFQLLKTAKPDTSDITLKNYESFYNKGVEYFKSKQYREYIKDKDITPVYDPKRFFENIGETTTFLNLQYPKLNVRLARMNAWVAVCLAFEKTEIAKKVKKIKNDIEEFEKLKNKQALENRTILNEDVEKNYIEIFEDIKKSLIQQAELVMDFFETEKTGYTIIELKQINKLAFMSLVANAFLLPQNKLLYADNPPRRLDYRFLKYHEGKDLAEFNYLNRIHPKFNIYRFVYKKYKKQAQKYLGEQKFNVDKNLMKILKMYLTTHKNIRKSDILFPQNLYNSKEEKVYESYQLSKIIKKYFGYNMDDIRHAYISKAYETDHIPDVKVLQGLAYRMAHSFKTAMANYRQFSKIK